MEFCENEIYHVYNRGNNKQLIFFNEGNYHFFKKKIQKELLPFCDVIAYCLMPNHFHLLIRIKENSGLTTRVASNISSSILLSRRTTDLSYTISRKLGTLQSSYSRAIQIQQNLSGSLFQQKIKNKLIENSKSNYLYTCFHYIHQNPVKAGLVEKLESW
jgi:REP element-mobilizing transposase RayT